MECLSSAVIIRSGALSLKWTPTFSIEWCPGLPSLGPCTCRTVHLSYTWDPVCSWYPTPPTCPVYPVLWSRGNPWVWVWESSHAFEHTDPSVLLSIQSHGPMGTHGTSLGTPHTDPVLLSILSHGSVGTHGTSLGIPCISSHRPLCLTVHPVPWTRRNPWDVLGNAMRSNTQTHHMSWGML